MVKSKDFFVTQRRAVSLRRRNDPRKSYSRTRVVEKRHPGPRICAQARRPAIAPQSFASYHWVRQRKATIEARPRHGPLSENGPGVWRTPGAEPQDGIPSPAPHLVDPQVAHVWRTCIPLLLSPRNMGPESQNLSEHAELWFVEAPDSLVALFLVLFLSRSL